MLGKQIRRNPFWFASVESFENIFFRGVKRPSHDKLKFANSCWQTLKSWQTHAFTRQTRVNSKHTPICNMADIVQWHSQRRVAACVLLLFCVKRRRKNRKRWRKRLIWTKPYISRNPSLGVYNTLVQELRAEDTAAFKNFLRMDQNCFDELLEMVKPHIQKQDTNMRKSISAGEKLALTSRYLATGEFIYPVYNCSTYT